MGDTVKRITELIYEGQHNFEQKRQWANREPLPNYFDCLDGSVLTGSDTSDGSETKNINTGKQEETCHQ